MLNTTVLGRYEIKKQVRENDLFAEYWGEDTKMGRDIMAVAIHARLIPAADFFSRFNPVNKKLAGNKTSHLPVLVELGEVDGQAVIIRQHAEGQSLREMLGAGNLPLELVLDIAQQSGEYLDLLHQAGLTQIAFELEDVLISAGNEMQVTNFGIVQGVNLGGLLSTNQLQARISYAPELLKGGKVDARTDFYSLGALLFESLTGKKPSVNLEPADKTIIENFFPSRLRIGISSEWDVLVAKCLHPDPSKRIQSAAEFLNQVDEIRRAMTTLASDSLLGMEDSLVGQTLGGYRLVSRLGQGGMATVYKAYEPALDRYVAVKVLPQFFAKDPVFVQRFRREAKAVAQLNHPNIVPIYSYGEAGGITYIAMQFVVGDTLKHESEQKFSFEESLRLLAPIARALAYAHQRGIVHRDIKPSNILLADGNWPVLADFGLAQMAQVSGKLTESGVGMGTPMYMSPEQGQGEKVDHRTDIYSLGIVLYELITGDVPFRADTPMAIVIKHISAPMPMPHQVNPDIPDYLEAIILKATAKNPDDRYQTAEEMAIAMENTLARLSSSLPALTPPPARVAALAVKQKPAPVESKPEVKEAAKPTAFKKIMRTVMFLLAGIICTPILLVVLMAVFNVCPPQGPWPQPPWCEGSLYQLPIFGGSEESTPAPAQADIVLDDFESQTYWQSSFEDGTNTKIDCRVDDSHNLRDSNYLSFDFDVAAHSWGTCGFDFENTKSWQAGKGIAFYLRSDQANMPYEVMLLDSTSDTAGMYLYTTKTPPESVNGWVRVEIPWSDILRVEWEDRAGAPFDPASVGGFRFQISPGEANQKGKLWIDDLGLLQSYTPPADASANLFSEDFEHPAWTHIESYVQENTDTKASCAIDSSAATDNAFSLKFQFDAAPDTWATCGFSFVTMKNWRAGEGIGFDVRSDKAGMPYYVNLVTSPADDNQSYLYETSTTSETLTDWVWVEIPWEDFLRVEWEENAGTPLDPVAIVGLWLEVSPSPDARETGTIWIDDFQVIP